MTKLAIKAMQDNFYLLTQTGYMVAKQPMEGRGAGAGGGPLGGSAPLTLHWEG